MAPSAGHLHKLVIRNVKLIKAAWKSASQNLQSRVQLLRPAELQPIPVRVSTQQGSNGLSYISRSQARSFSTGATSRGFSTSTARGAKPSRGSIPNSKTFTAVRSSTGRAPFASTLRPNLTGGTLNRTAGGYTLGSGRAGGARYFSHGPAAPAEVIQNVGQAVRAFCLSGKRAQYNGTDRETGNKRYRAVTNVQDETSKRISSLPKATPGSYIDFAVNPTITAFTPLASLAGYSSAGFDSECEFPCNLNSTGLLDVLSADFSRALKDLLTVLNDLKSLSALGDLPITYRSPSILRVHFPGCDSGTIENLCSELDVKRGVIFQDEEFDTFAGTEIALLFPFAPSEAESSNNHSSPKSRIWGSEAQWQDRPLFPSHSTENEFSTYSDSEMDLFENTFDHANDESWLSSPEQRKSMSSRSGRRTASPPSDLSGSPLEYQDFEGIYRFINMCDEAKR